MPGKRGARTFLDHLPEGIIDRILIRLPPRDVGRCRVVCALWRSVTSRPEFMLEHRRRQPSLPIVDGAGRSASLVVVRDAGARTSSQQLWPFLAGFEHRNDEVCLRCTCDGFTIIARRGQFYICNPVTRKQALLPQPPSGLGVRTTVIALYMHHPTGEYRVLWVSGSQNWTESSLYVLTVGSDKPRHVEVTMPTVLSASMEWVLVEALIRTPPIQHRGSLHWCPADAKQITGDGEDIIVFDTQADSFRWMRSPNLLIQPDVYHMGNLLNMQEALAFSVVTLSTLDVWVMQDYEANIWAFKYRIDLPRVEKSRQLNLTSLKRKRMTPLDTTVRWFNQIAMFNDRELLIQFNRNRVLRCDTDGKVAVSGMVKIGKKQYCMVLTGHRLQESMIPIPCHEIQQEDDEPPFSATRNI
ncbi:putative F-box protein At2g02030 [Triticum dicoccoides]|uniref:putative F-box protein At2g02030 n=1 Tax=Triticum dicoccoides TaxID=85692 RepID=UPI0018917036|nr:putative F-box protein At2g02030 [Triticum dicoccoides]